MPNTLNPGRKTDVKDAEWIADLLQHGLVKGSYIPDRDQRELRELTRYRRSLIEERGMQKVLEGANIKLSSVATDITGVSGRSMIEAIINGVDDPKMLSLLVKGRMNSKREQLERALHGLVGPHQKMLLSAQLKHIDFLDQQIALLGREIAERMRPFEENLALLDTVTGIGQRNAQDILAETANDMNRFPTEAHISSWAGMAPGNNESAGKRKSGRTRKGVPTGMEAVTKFIATWNENWAHPFKWKFTIDDLKKLLCIEEQIRLPNSSSFMA